MAAKKITMRQFFNTVGKRTKLRPAVLRGSGKETFADWCLIFKLTPKKRKAA